MGKPFLHTGFFLLLLLTASSLDAQKATERFIPIGKSPGLSGSRTITGTIDSVSTAAYSVVVQDSAGVRHTFTVTDQTKIYLDKSALKETNQVGGLQDCRPGRFCEVLYKGRVAKTAGPAEWIKIRVEGTEGQ